MAICNCIQSNRCFLAAFRWPLLFYLFLGNFPFVSNHIFLPAPFTLFVTWKFTLQFAWNPNFFQGAFPPISVGLLPSAIFFPGVICTAQWGGEANNPIRKNPSKPLLSFIIFDPLHRIPGFGRYFFVFASKKNPSKLFIIFILISHTGISPAGPKHLPLALDCFTLT